MASTSKDNDMDESSDEVYEDLPEDGNEDQFPHRGAPRYSIPSRDLAAVEVPAVIENIDRAIKAFGRVPNLKHALDPVRNSIPFYLNPESSYCPPIMSHSARSQNVVLKVTVPKRTGRKRKRGSNGPWLGDDEVSDANVYAESTKPTQVCSIARLDQPNVLRRKLEDNVGSYQVEAVGVIKHTHRFRGLADFYWDMNKSSFARRFAEQVLPGDVQQMKAFKFEPGTDKGPNVDIIPPPIFTHMSLPFNYFYSQNPYVKTTEDGETINTTAVKHIGYFISAEDPAPDGPQEHPDMTDYRMVEIVADLEKAFEDRPVWTRRSIMNHLGGKLRNWNELKKYLNYTAYQFKGGPWRDGVVPYGIDPRTDPKYRIYQTLMFKLSKKKRAHKDQTWQSLRRDQAGGGRDYPATTPESHIFDGETFHTDGKVWQVCDITDPLLKELLDNAEVRPTWDISSGWYHGGLWAKVKAIMKTKLVGIQFGRRLTKRDFATTLNCGDRTPTGTAGPTFHLPLPNLNLTDEELTILHGREPPKKKTTGYKARIRGLSKAGSMAGDGSPAAQSQSAGLDLADMDVDNDESDSDGDGDADADVDIDVEGNGDGDEDEGGDGDGDGDEDGDRDEVVARDEDRDNNESSEESTDDELPEEDYPEPPILESNVALGTFQSFQGIDMTGASAFRYPEPPVYTAPEPESEEEEDIEELTDMNAVVYPELD